MAYAIYLRKSRADEEAESRGEGETLARHRSALLDLARRMNLPVVEIYQEVASGDTIQDRSEMKRLLADVAAHRFDGVLCMAVDRLGRGDGMDQAYIMQTFLYSGTAIITPEKTYDPANPSDFEFFEMRQFFARREYSSIKGRMQAGRELASKEGYFIGSRAPFGYRIVPTPDKRSYTLSIDPEQASVVRQIYDWYINGIDGKEVGCSVIAQRLNAMRIENSLGNPWIESTIRRLIMNPVYKGRITWAKRKQQIAMQDGRRIKRRALNPDHVDVKGVHDPIIDDDTWAAANATLSDSNKSHATLERKTAFVFAGILKCGYCGRAMIRQRNYSHPEYDIVKCSTPGCTNHGSYITTIEKLVLAQLEEWLLTVPSTHSEIKASQQAQKERIHKQLHTLAAQLDKLHDLLEQGVYDIPTFLQRQRALSDKEASLRAQLTDLDTPPQISPELLILRLTPRIRSTLDAYALAGSPAEKNVLLKSLISRIVYTKPRRRYKNESEFAAITLDFYPRST